MGQSKRKGKVDTNDSGRNTIENHTNGFLVAFRILGNSGLEENPGISYLKKNY